MRFVEILTENGRDKLFGSYSRGTAMGLYMQNVSSPSKWIEENCESLVCEISPKHPYHDTAFDNIGIVDERTLFNSEYHVAVSLGHYFDIHGGYYNINHANTTLVMDDNHKVIPYDDGILFLFKKKSDMVVARMYFDNTIPFVMDRYTAELIARADAANDPWEDSWDDF